MHLGAPNLFCESFNMANFDRHIASEPGIAGAVDLNLRYAVSVGGC